ncbi:SPOR domain-containing protein [Pelagibius sp. CAU 1746]|uniref:SPOR domain-containing protein n=1 Tax=Pelagibius sp. CAU 1746 TaxID=3140370 RepID=UPI00325BB24C
MTQHKAASLTSNLFARKGRASPASLLIAEIEGAPLEERKLKPKRAAEGVRRMNLSAAARKAKEPEELPLLAFVEAQAGERENDGVQGTQTAEPREPEEKAERTAAVPVAETADEPSPPASLLDRGARALRQANGRRPALGDSAPDEAEGEAQLSPAPAPAEDSAAAGNGDAASGMDAGPEPETVSGDENVAAIEDVPRDDEDEPQTDGCQTVGDQAAEAEVSGRTGAELAAEQDGSEEIEAEEPGAPQTDGTPEALKPGAAPVRPAVSQKLGTEAALSATVALRQAAALRATPMPRPKPQTPEAATAAPPPKPSGVALPWRSAAVVLLGAALGLGSYIAFSGAPEVPPVETPAAEVPSNGTAANGTEANGTAANGTAANGTGAAVRLADVPDAIPLMGESAPAGAAAQAPEPSFDVIRIEPDGQSIIAGRATPGSEWILLNNGEPIASVQADANGEWVVLPDASLVPGANAFSLVPKTERGKVAIPAPAERENLSEQPAPGVPAAPQSSGGAGAAVTPRETSEADVGVALPQPKPAVRGDRLMPNARLSRDGDFELQVASVRQSAAAERERLRLAAAYPNLLGALELRVQEASVDGAGTFFRVRSGTIADLGAAREVCRRLEAEGQGCLVVRRALPGEEPQTEVVRDDPEDPAGGHRAPEQQAQRP